MKKLALLATAGAFALGAAFLLPSDAADAAAYLKIGDIKGESTDDEHKGEIAIESWSWGETQSGSAASGMPTAKRQHKPLTITKKVDKSSPMLQRAANTGKMIDQVELTLPKEGGTKGEYLKYELKNVLVSSYQTGGSSGGDVPMETISLNYEKISWTPVQRSQSDMEFLKERAKRKKD